MRLVRHLPPRFAAGIRASAKGLSTAASKGSVLILALWALFFLAALAVVVGTRVSASLDLARRIQDDTEARLLARAAVAKVMIESAADTNVWDGLDEPWYNDERTYKDVTLGDGRYSVSYEMEAQEGRRETRYGVTGEESKININRASQAEIKVFLETAAGADSIAATELAAAICDWRDPDDEPLTGGAENSYYQSLNPPYGCHNGEFESLRELLLVKGMGGELFRRIERYMTVYGSGKVNINTADAVVLTSVARASGGQAAGCESLVAKLMAFRSGGGVFREPVSSVMTRQLSGATNLRPEEEALFSAMMGTMAIRSTCFGGTACGKARGRETEQSRIDFVFDRERVVRLDWHEH